MKIVCITPDRKEDYTTSNIIEGLYDLGHQIYATDYGNGVKDTDIYPEETFKSMNPDLVFAFFGKLTPDNRQPKYHLLKHFPKEICVYIDGSEWNYDGWIRPGQTSYRGPEWLNLDRLKDCQYYFKRETYLDDLAMGVLPLPFGMMNKHVLPEKPFNEREIDMLCCFGQIQTGLRAEVEVACSKLFHRTVNYKIVVENDVSHETYVNMLHNSKIAVDCWGGGNCCGRFWEIVGAGAACLYQKYEIITPFWLNEGTQALSFSNMKEFKDKALFLLENQEYAETIAWNGNFMAKKLHDSRGRAEYIMASLYRFDDEVAE